MEEPGGLASVPDPTTAVTDGQDSPPADVSAASGTVEERPTSVPAHRTHESAISPFRVVVVVVLVAAGLIAWQLTRPSGPAYRTALVSTGTAVASLSSVGTVTPVNQANLNFDVAGTVGAVDVTVGQQVTAGETVASLDSTPLKNAVIADQASLASAQATLASDEASQTAATTTSSDSTTTTTAATLTSVTTSGSGGSPGGGSPGGGTSGGGSQSVAQLQAKLVADQKQEDADSAAASAALATATSVCTAPSTPATTSAPASTTSNTTTTTTPPTTPTCTEALSAASAAQTTLTGDIATVASDEAALTTALEAAASSSSGAGSTGSTGGSAAAPTSGSTGSANTGKPSAGSSSTASSGASSGAAGSSGKAKVVTAQKLALDQSDIDVAQANLDSAQQSLASADLVSPISGTVGSVTLTVGSSVSAGSSSTSGQVVVLGSGNSYQVVATVPVASISKVAVGQQALVTPDSSGTAVPGTVTGIGVLATSGTTSTTYPVTVTIQSPGLGLFSGGEAGVSIVTGRAVGVTTVPTSAVHTEGTVHLVTEVVGTTTKQVKVTTGIVGAVLTQITSGVKPGEQISIATMDLPVPSSSTTSTRSGFGGLGGATGFPTGAGGFGGGGFGGGTRVGSAIG